MSQIEPSSARPSSARRPSAASALASQRSLHDPSAAVRASSARRQEPSVIDEEEDGEARLAAELPFPEPFALSPGSPFHPDRARADAPRCVKARYAAYSLPPAPVQQSVVRSLARSMLRAARERQEALSREEQRRALRERVQGAAQAGAGEGAHAAADRIRAMNGRVTQYHEQQILHVVEAQTTALDAIRLKAILTSGHNYRPHVALTVDSAEHMYRQRCDQVMRNQQWEVRRRAAASAHGSFSGVSASGSIDAVTTTPTLRPVVMSPSDRRRLLRLAG